MVRLLLVRPRAGSRQGRRSAWCAEPRQESGDHRCCVFAAGAIAGIIVGIVVFLGLCVGVAVALLLKQRAARMRVARRMAMLEGKQLSGHGPSKAPMLLPSSGDQVRRRSSLPCAGGARPARSLFPILRASSLRA